MVQDGLIFYDENSGKKMIFNQYSYCEYVKWNMVKYAHLTYQEANDIVNGSHLSKKIESYRDIYAITHELPYHWAMLLAHGELYWHKGIPYPEPCEKEDMIIWEKELSQKHNLKLNEIVDYSE